MIGFFQGFLQAFIVGAVFWATFLGAWVAHCEELPPAPAGKTTTLEGQLVECYPTDEFRKVVLWVETAKHLNSVNSDLLALVDTTRAELTVVGQENAIKEQQLKGAFEEIKRLQDLALASEKARQKAEKRGAAFVWTSVGLLVGGILIVGITAGLRVAQ